MNIDEMIETIHNANASVRLMEHRKRERRRVVRWVAPAAPAAVAAAAVALLVVLPRGNAAQAAPAVAGVYCNSQCNPDDVMALIDNQINHIKTLQVS